MTQPTHFQATLLATAIAATLTLAHTSAAVHAQAAPAPTTNQSATHIAQATTPITEAEKKAEEDRKKAEAERTGAQRIEPVVIASATRSFNPEHKPHSYL